MNRPYYDKIYRSRQLSPIRRPFFAGSGSSGDADSLGGIFAIGEDHDATGIGQHAYFEPEPEPESQAPSEKVASTIKYLESLEQLNGVRLFSYLYLADTGSLIIFLGDNHTSFINKKYFDIEKEVKKLSDQVPIVPSRRVPSLHALPYFYNDYQNLCSDYTGNSEIIRHGLDIEQLDNWVVKSTNIQKPFVTDVFRNIIAQGSVDNKINIFVETLNDRASFVGDIRTKLLNNEPRWETPFGNDLKWLRYLDCSSSDKKKTLIQ